MNTITTNTNTQYQQLPPQSQAENISNAGVSTNTVAIHDQQVTQTNGAYSLNLSPEAQNYLSGLDGQIIQVNNSLSLLDPAETNPQLIGESLQEAQLV